mmetsp:Transcript_124/g.148  ORF Transcript_124/g.148 Transcript_124/m.148 type:complete len:442 (+) Transcript_124:77-1402(+)
MSIVADVFIVLASFLGVFVTFVGLAVLCDEWLVPHLITLQHKLRLSDDIAGCTLMAFGGAAPEIMISTVAVLGGDVDVGFGIVCGSAIIAFGFIPPFCYYSIHKPMQIRPWIVLRDSFAYIIALGMVTAFMFTNGGVINIYESVGLLVFYLIYILIVVFAPHPEDANLKRRKSNFIGVIELRKDNNKGPSETSPLMASDETEKGGGEDNKDHDETDIEDYAIVKCFTPLYTPFANGFDFIFKYTIPQPPEEDEVTCPEDAAKISTMWNALGVFMAFVWLAGLSEGIYELVLLICDHTGFLQPVTVGGIFLAVGAQVPDALGAASMAKQGQIEGAISSTLSSQVISITLAFGIPWTIYIAMGSVVDLAQSETNKISDSSLLGVVVLLTLTFVVTTVYSPGVSGFVQIDAKSSITTFSAFILAVIAFIVIEVLTEIGDDGMFR